MVSAGLRSFVLAACLFGGAFAAGKAGTFETVGDSGVSAQMMFLGSESKVYILDKAERNGPQVNGHPAYAVEYDYIANTARPMNATANPWCAGGTTLGDGRWFVTGGNAAVNFQDYQDYDGGRAIRLLSPRKEAVPAWRESNSNILAQERWYATVEPLHDGSAAVVGGMRGGGFVSTSDLNQPSFETYPKFNRGTKQIDMLQRAVPLSLYPHTYLLSNGKLFLQAKMEAIIYDMDTEVETSLPDIPDVPRVYPASGGSVLLPLTPKNNHKEVILFCGGTDLGSDAAWGDTNGPAGAVSQVEASESCQEIAPLDKNPKWTRIDGLQIGRTMGQFITLPNGQLVFINGARTGVAGYGGNSANAPVGQSYADNPSYLPTIYDQHAPVGQKWRQVGQTTNERLYHSSATLLPDGSILIAGSNPNADVSFSHWPTSWTVERYYPEYYDATRPSNKQLPTKYSYGGSEFTIKFSSSKKASKAKVVLIRTGFSTHGMNMGQRMIELDTARSGSTLHVAQLPPNPNLFAPGPALAFIVVDGIPSQGKFVMIGNGSIGKQPKSAKTTFSVKRDEGDVAEDFEEEDIFVEEDAEDDAERRSEPSKQTVDELIARAKQAQADKRAIEQAREHRRRAAVASSHF